MFRIPTFIAALALTTLIGTAPRAEDFPKRPITILVGLSAGGITDVTARLYAEAVSKNIGQRIVIENRPTASGAVAATAVQNAPPDGYTLLVFSGSQHAAIPAAQPGVYEPVKGFQPITLLFNIVTFIAVPADSPAKTMDELLALGKTKPGGLSFGSPGVGTPSHLLAARIGRATKTPMEFIHYRGGAPMLADLVTGRVDFALPSYTVARSYVAEKKLRVLAIDAESRWSSMADVPTLTEVGLGKEKVAAWFGLAAPAGTPKEIVDKLNAEFVKVSKDPDFIKRLADNGTPIVTTTPEKMGQLMAKEWEETGELVRAIGMKQQQ